MARAAAENEDFVALSAQLLNEAEAGRGAITADVRLEIMNRRAQELSGFLTAEVVAGSESELLFQGDIRLRPSRTRALVLPAAIPCGAFVEARLRIPDERFLHRPGGAERVVRSRALCA